MLTVQQDKSQMDSDSFNGSWGPGAGVLESDRLVSYSTATCGAEDMRADPSTLNGHVKTAGTLRQYAAACSASLMVMTTGCWLGWPSPAIRKLQANETSLLVSHEQISWIVALMDAGSAVSPVPAGFLMDAVGRKMTLLVTGALFAVTWLMALFAQTPVLLYVARFLAGMGKGVAFTVAPMYLGEIASPGIRGALSTMFAGLLWAGTLFEFGIGPYVKYQTLIILNLIVPIAFLLTFAFIPESPYWLITRRRNEQARKALRWLRNGPKVMPGDDMDLDPVEHELKEIKKTVNQETQNQGSYADLSSPSNSKAMIIVIVISMFQRTCGISPLLAYSSTTLPPTQTFIGPEQIIVVFGIILTVSNFVATPLVDRLGRKPLLVFSGAGCGVATGISAVFYYLHEKTDVDTLSYLWVPYACICMFGFTHSVGIGVLPHTLLSELFPTNVKCYAASLSSITFAVASFAINKVYGTVKIHIGVYAMFIFFSLNGIACAIFSLLVIFETKGKTFSEIQRILHSKG